MMNALKAGVAPESVRRPLARTKVIDANKAHMTFTSQPKQIDKQETEDKPYPMTASSSGK
ncbi:MAG: hypothetical protein FP811_13345 [Desulfobacteraceae bacterium]|nr:hypothetical protein [Desulfobacteraceae bacterium]